MQHIPKAVVGNIGDIPKQRPQTKNRQVANKASTKDLQVVHKASSTQSVIGHMTDHRTMTGHKTNTVGRDHRADKWMTGLMTQQMTRITGPRSVHWTSIGPPGRRPKGECQRKASQRGMLKDRLSAVPQQVQYDG